MDIDLVVNNFTFQPLVGSGNGSTQPTAEREPEDIGCPKYPNFTRKPRHEVFACTV